MLIPAAQIKARGDTELDYVEITAPVVISATTDATANTVITGNPIVLNGSTRIIVEFGAEQVATGGTTSSAVIVTLWDSTTDLGHFHEVGTPANGVVSVSALVRRFLTPSAGTHTYVIKAFRNVADGTIYAGTGGVGNDQPAYLRVTLA